MVDLVWNIREGGVLRSSDEGVCEEDSSLCFTPLEWDSSSNSCEPCSNESSAAVDISCWWSATCSLLTVGF